MGDVVLTDDEVRALMAAHDPRGYCDGCCAYVNPESITEDGYHRDCPEAAALRARTLVRVPVCLTTNDSVRALCVEVRRLRAIVEGRPTAPTQEEIAAHPGQWLVYYAARFEDRQPARTRLLDRTRATAAAAARWPTAPSRWCPVRDGRPCAWPVAEVSGG